MIYLKKFSLDDLDAYKYWQHPSHKYHNFNGPYYGKMNEDEIEIAIMQLRSRLKRNEDIDSRRLICDSLDNIIGEVSWYWKSKETYWMEMGIIIFDEEYWGQNLGYKALSLWTDEIFNTHPKLARIGLTTWSGNERMMNLAEKLKMKKEAVYRKARIVNDKYYDSVSYGILKDEWLQNKEDE